MLMCYKWGNVGITWADANWVWSECLYVVESILQPPGVDAMTLVQPWLIEPWNPYVKNDEREKKRKRFIKLICKIKGQTYEDEKEMGMMNISVDDIKMVVKTITNVDLDVKMEK